jgi:hypothetical protein
VFQNSGRSLRRRAMGAGCHRRQRAFATRCTLFRRKAAVVGHVSIVDNGAAMKLRHRRIRVPRHCGRRVRRPHVSHPHAAAVAASSAAPPVDSDHDGITDALDACPTSHGRASAERSRNGCPRGVEVIPVASPSFRRSFSCAARSPPLRTARSSGSSCSGRVGSFRPFSGSPPNDVVVCTADLRRAWARARTDIAAK